MKRAKLKKAVVCSPCLRWVNAAVPLRCKKEQGWVTQHGRGLPVVGMASPAVEVFKKRLNTHFPVIIKVNSFCGQQVD